MPLAMLSALFSGPASGVQPRPVRRAEIPRKVYRAESYGFWQIYEDWIEDHFAIGFRIIDYNFKRRFQDAEGDEEYFIGSNNAIEAEDRGFGLHNFKLAWYPWAGTAEEVHPSVQPIFMVIQGLGVELAYDHLRARTVTMATPERPEYSDGTVIAKGPMVSYVLRVDNPTRVTPYMGIGTAFYSDASVSRDWWHLGFSSESEYDRWRDAGAVGDPNDGWRRTFSVDTETGIFWYIGATIAVYENWQLDLFYRNTDVEFDNTYTISSRGKVVDTRYSKWDLSNKTYGIGVLYRF